MQQLDIAATIYFGQTCFIWILEPHLGAGTTNTCFRLKVVKNPSLNVNVNVRISDKKKIISDVSMMLFFQ